MEPAIRYTKTPDGVRLAYWTLGEGAPVLFMFPWASHLQLEWQIPSNRYLYQEFARTHKLVRFDLRGSGLSQHHVPMTLDHLVQDIAHVLDAIGAPRASIIAAGASGPIAITFATTCPDRIDRLVLWEAPASLDDGGPQLKAFLTLLEQDYELWVQALASVSAGFEQNEDARAFAQTIRGSMQADEMMEFTRLAWSLDASGRLAQLACPTLIIQFRDVQLVAGEAMQRLAADIAGSELVVLEGSTVYSSMPEAAAAVQRFLGVESPAHRQDAGPPGVRTVLFTDIVGHTEMMQRLGDAKGRDVLREHERITRDLLKQHGGAEVKTMGDGFLASFTSVTSALDCAIALQRAFNPAHLVGAQPVAPAVEAISIRVGLNAGEPIEEDGDLFGATVILASRIAAKAGPGEILVPDTVRGLLSGKNFLFSDRGDFIPKGFDDAVRLYEVRWRE